MRRAKARMGEEGGGGAEEEGGRRWDAGRCLFKTRSQHHRMSGRNQDVACLGMVPSSALARNTFGTGRGS
eukprot:8886184-Pyramimonas_sp.AAC.1